MITRSRLLALLLLLLLLVCLPAQLSLAQTTAVLLPNAKQTFVDLNGQPLAGGSVYFYIPNTTTSKTTWQDAAETVPNANPVVLDAAGRAVVFGSGAYRQLVKDQFGNTVWDGLTYAPTTAAVATIAALQALGATSPGVGLVYVNGYNSATGPGGGWFAWNPGSVATADFCVTFAATGVGTGRWIRQLVNPSEITVEDCGAYNDGTNGAVTRAAWQAAVNYISALPGASGDIQCFGQTYLFDTTQVQIFAGTPSFHCGGQNTTRISFSPGSPLAALFYKGPSGSVCNCKIEGLSVGGNSNTIGVEDDGVDGLGIELAVHAVGGGVLLCNCTSGHFTEMVRVKLQTDGTVVTPLEYRVSGGTDSFHGSGLVAGSVVNLDGTHPGILIGAGAAVYDAPLEGSFFTPQSGNSTLIVNNSTDISVALFKGTFGVEEFSSGVLTLATTNPVMLTGEIQSWGDVGRFGRGTLNQSRFVQTTAAGDFRSIYDPISATGSFASGTSKVIASAPAAGSYNQWAVELQIVDTNYDYVYYGTFVQDGFGTCAWSSLANPINNNTAGFGAPSLSCSSSGLAASNGSYTAGTTFQTTMTQIGSQITHPIP